MKRGAAAAGVLLTIFAAGALARADETYAGTLAVTPAGGTPLSIPLTLVVRKHTSDERATQLAQLLHEKGHAAVVAELAREDAGEVRVGDAARFRVTLVRREPRPKGQVLRIVTERPVSLDAKPPTSGPPADAVGYLELTLASDGTGEGRLMPAVRAKFDNEGFVAPDDVGGVIWRVTSVKRN